MSITKHDSNWSRTEYFRLQYSGCNKSTTLMGSESSWHPHTAPATTLYWALLTSVSGDDTKMRHWLNTTTRKKNNLLWKLLWHCLFHKVAPWKSNFVCMELAEAELFCFLEVSDKQVPFYLSICSKWERIDCQVTEVFLLRPICFISKWPIIKCQYSHFIL